MPIKPFDDRTPMESSAEAIAAIEGAALLIDRFGEWPLFEDAEVLSLSLERGNHWWVLRTGDWERRVPDSLTVTLFVFDSMQASDALERKESRVVLRFEGLGRCELDGFNHQNPVVALIVTFEYSPDMKSNLFAVEWGGTALPHEVSLTCERIQVLSVEPMEWTFDGVRYGELSR